MLHVSWDPVLIGISFLVAFIAAFVSLDSAGKVAISVRRESTFWRLSGGITLGMGIWSMHFIGMLAMKMSMPLSYHLPLTFLSFVVALLAASFAIHIAISGPPLSRIRLIAATIALSVEMVAMHYVGMAAVIGHGVIVWNPGLVGLSVLIAVMASGFGLRLAFLPHQNMRQTLLNRLAAAVIVALAISAMHYTGMNAATFNHHDHALQTGLSQGELAIFVTGITLVTLGMILVISVLDSHVRASQLAENLSHLNKKLTQQSHFDALTGLPNRAQIDTCLLAFMENTALHQHRFVLAFIDLDRFKVVNDTWGHHIGDQLLVASSQRILACLDDTMTLARLGGDEFILLMPENDTEAISTRMDRITNAIRMPFSLSGHIIHVSLSAGLSVYPEHGTTTHELRVKADVAMYHVKQQGRDGWAIYQPEMEALVTSAPAFLQDLSQALARNEFELWYQPKYTAGDHTLTGFEALLRWRHPEQGLLLPGAFLPTLEDTGLMIAVGKWVIQQACSQLSQWIQQGHPDWSLAVNLSATQFEQHDIVDVVCGALARYQIPPSRLTLEITESAALKNPGRSIEILNIFSAAGITVSIDDFGTGYSNMLMLKSLPARELKIDRIFIKDINENNKNSKIVSAIIDIAHSMNLRVVAEGIETPEQERLLTQMGCAVLQGFLYAQPLPAQQIPALLQRDSLIEQLNVVSGLPQQRSITL
ncbi:TPA: EAL domain-containing protein [Citrobacter farmeri]|uniref:putative bifunctional diguanylate cyclase/phosphodiesterase n=1 Tax=Citrobacter farmeri TaxID=67824 RepID=UPI001E2ED0B2|nr:EAL domain-containing protein [Citrobacter farmeri]GJL45004.1 bifunctional diguanylate cyclase/phosphodiesterase [Citrobacter farmeri]HEM7970288.1 EAL domain-containing protein [Citrobacter farmeri]HEM7983704.1 EAL domain-containing protein [Citrobacter farmeri]